MRTAQHFFYAKNAEPRARRVLVLGSVAALVLDHTLFAGRLSLRGWLGIGLAVAAIVVIEWSRPHPAPTEVSAPTTGLK